MKDYKKWSIIKSNTNNSGDKPKGYSERQIWWCKVGENVGVESDGKGNEFLRPVLIIKKFGYEAFFGVPLTSVSKPERPFYYKVSFKNKVSTALLSQARTWDAARLVRKMGEIDLKIFSNIKTALKEYLEL